MSDGVVLQFPSDMDAQKYKQVNERLGINPQTGEGDWPAGLESHIAGVTENGLMVVEVWESREIQGAFMESRLMPAFQEVGVPQPSSVMWFEVLGRHHT
jgi:hypothetical protein